MGLRPNIRITLPPQTRQLLPRKMINVNEAGLGHLCKFVLSFHVVASHWNKSIKNEDGAIPTPSHHRPSKWSPWRIIILACTVSGIRKRTHLIHYIYILFVFFLFCSIRFKKKKTKTRCSFLQCFPEFSKSLNYSLRYSSTLKLFLKFYLLF